MIETTSMAKVYKMPVLAAFCGPDQIKLAVTGEELLDSWKAFFGNGTNWKDLDPGMSREDYLKITDREHLRKILRMPVHFLLGSGKGFFVRREGYALALRDEMVEVIRDPVFVRHVRDAIDYQIMDYYQRRYAGQRNAEEQALAPGEEQPGETAARLHREAAAEMQETGAEQHGNATAEQHWNATAELDGNASAEHHGDTAESLSGETAAGSGN